MTKIIGSAALTAADPTGENLTTKGDLHGYSSENTRIPIGDNDQVLTADSAQALGLKWGAAGGATTAIQRVVLGSTFNTSSSEFVDATGMAVTLPDNDGHSFISFQLAVDMNAGTGYITFRLVDDTTNLVGITLSIATAGYVHIVAYPYCASNDGQVIKLQVNCNANNIDINAGAGLSSEISVLNVS